MVSYFLTSSSFCCASLPATQMSPSLDTNHRNFSNHIGLRVFAKSLRTRTWSNSRLTTDKKIAKGLWNLNWRQATPGVGVATNRFESSFSLCLSTLQCLDTRLNSLLLLLPCCFLRIEQLLTVLEGIQSEIDRHFHSANSIWFPYIIDVSDTVTEGVSF